MGNGTSTNDKLEEARYQVEKVEIVVHGAKLVCSCTGKSKRSNYISVMDGHGIMQGGNNCAHDAACVPIKNITPFASCTSANVGKALSALIINANSEEKAKYSIALEIFNKNKNSSSKIPVPCTLPLLERWFDAEEKEIVTDSMDMDIEVKQMVKKLEGNLKKSLKKGADDAYAAYVLVLYTNSDMSLEEKVAYKKKSEELKTFQSEIGKLCSKTVNAMNTKIQSIGEDFKNVIGELENAKGNINQISIYWDKAYELYSGLLNYNEYKNMLINNINEIDEIIKRIIDWKEKEYHLITTKSFLVCRCGGIISFLDSGQIYGNTVDKIMSSLLTMMTEFKEHCQVAMVEHCIEEMDYLDHEWSSYNAAAKGLGGIEKMLFEPGEVYDSANTSIYIELICHSYNDEISKRLMSILSLISIEVDMLSFALALYTVLTTEYNAQGIVDKASATISGLEAAGGVISKYGGGVIVKYNNLFTVLTSITNFFYVSYDTWIENIKITVFTASHAHISERKLKRSGELEKGKDIQLHTKAAFISDGTGRGLKWEEDPGVYMKNLVNMGDNKKVGEEVEGGDNIEGKVPKS